jgi:hypothetical protein
MQRYKTTAIYDKMQQPLPGWKAAVANEIINPKNYF